MLVRVPVLLLLPVLVMFSAMADWGRVVNISYTFKFQCVTNFLIFYAIISIPSIRLVSGYKNRTFIFITGAR